MYMQPAKSIYCGSGVYDCSTDHFVLNSQLGVHL